MEKKIYLVKEYHEGITKTAKLSEEQAKLIDWLNEEFTLPICCEEIDIEKIEEV